MHNVSLLAYNDLLNKLYDGAFESPPWHSFLTALDQILNLQVSFLFLRSPSHNDGGLMLSSGLVEAVTPENPNNLYTQSYYTSDPLVNLPIGRVVLIEEMIDRKTLEASELYQMGMEPFGIYYSAGIDLEYDNKQPFSVRLTRTREQGPFTADEREFLQMLAQHIQRAVASGDKLIRLDSERQMWASSVAGKSIGVVMLDDTGCIVRANAVADRRLAEKDGLSQMHQRLHLKNPDLNNKLKEYVQEALQAQREDKPVSINALAVPRPSGKPDYELVIKPLPYDPMIDSRGSPHLTVFIYAPDEAGEINLRLLMKLYQLTVTEASVAIMLTQGHTLDEVATGMNMARNTARAHLRAIFSKTGVTQQSMLVSLVLKSLASLP